MMNEKYSYKDFTNKILAHTDPAEWNDTEVIGSCFYQFEPNTGVFPSEIKNVTFIRCNLDNVVVPKECTIEGGCHRLIAAQNDGEDWILDANLNPVEPLDKTKFVKLQLSIDPAAIPAMKVPVSVTQAKIEEINTKLQNDIRTLQDAANWQKASTLGVK